jgi:predicted nucleotidyltransferase
MVMMSDIRKAAGNIARKFQPDRIMLFGSYAYGRPTENSDVDFLILMAGKRVHDRSLLIRQQIDFGFPVDLLVRSPGEFKRRIALGDCFLKEIQEKGKILYEASDARVGGKSRRRFSNRSARNARKKISKL